MVNKLSNRCLFVLDFDYITPVITFPLFWFWAFSFQSESSVSCFLSKTFLGLLGFVASICAIPDNKKQLLVNQSISKISVQNTDCYPVYLLLLYGYTEQTFARSDFQISFQLARRYF